MNNQSLLRKMQVNRSVPKFRQPPARFRKFRPHPRGPGPTPAGHRQLELRDEPVGERRPGESGEADRFVPLPDLDSVPPVDVEDPSPIGSQYGGGPVAQLQRDDARGRDDQWPGEQGVGTERDDHHRRDLRPHDRAAGRERVRRRAGRGRAHDAVTAPGR